MNSNRQIVLSLLNVALMSAAELSTLLGKAEAEKRDITDDEVQQLKSANDSKSQELIAKLRS